MLAPIRRPVLVPARMLVLVGALVLVGGSSPAALAHTEVREATPGPGERVEGPVDEIVLDFLDPVLPLTTMTVTTPDGRATPVVVEHPEPTRASAPLSPLRTPGRYRVDYAFVAADGDAQEEAFQFTITDPTPSRSAGGRPAGAAVTAVVVAALAATALRDRWHDRSAPSVTS